MAENDAEGQVVWGLWDCGDLVGVYARQSDAEADRAVLHAQAIAQRNRIPKPRENNPLGIFVDPILVHTGQWLVTEATS